MPDNGNWRGGFQQDDPPPFKGGQGRSDQAIEAEGRMVLVSMVIVAAIALAVGIAVGVLL